MSIVEVIEYNGGPSVYAWKYPSEEFGTWTQLIVNELQTAVLMKDGKALDVFESGRYTLETARIPLLTENANLPIGERSPFTAELWYINRAEIVGLAFGTKTPIQIKDPQYGICVPVRLSGMFSIRVEDPRKFMINLVPMMLIVDRENMYAFFKNLLLRTLMDLLPSYVARSVMNNLEINTYDYKLSECIKNNMASVMQNCGITMMNIAFRNISICEEDPAVKKLKDAMNGVTAEIPAGEPVIEKTDAVHKVCSQCGQEIIANAKFCTECGASLV